MEQVRGLTVQQLPISQSPATESLPSTHPLIHRWGRARWTSTMDEHDGRGRGAGGRAGTVLWRFSGFRPHRGQLQESTNPSLHRWGEDDGRARGGGRAGRCFGSSVAAGLTEASYSGPPIHHSAAESEDDGRGGGRAGLCFGRSVASGLAEPSYSNPPIHHSTAGARAMDDVRRGTDGPWVKPSPSCNPQKTA